MTRLTALVSAAIHRVRHATIRELLFTALILIGGLTITALLLLRAVELADIEGGYPLPVGTLLALLIGGGLATALPLFWYVRDWTPPPSND